tara:strand:+ start:40 stop:354 length:315 start_codon:yes stop_codon:yes gene_type:complete
MKMVKKKKSENLKVINRKHNQYIKSLGVNIDVDTGEIMSSFEGYPLPDLSCRPSLPTSDNIAGVGLKKKYATRVPAGKTISVAYNKGPYMIVDDKDFKTMGRKI